MNERDDEDEGPREEYKPAQRNERKIAALERAMEDHPEDHGFEKMFAHVGPPMRVHVTNE